MAVFYTLSQVMERMGNKRRTVNTFDQGDEFVMALGGCVFKFIWYNNHLSFNNYRFSSDSSGQSKLSKLLFGDSAYGGVNERRFVNSIIQRTYYSNYSIFDRYYEEDSKRILLKLFELYETKKRAELVQIKGEKMVILSEKFYGEGMISCKSSVTEFGDGTVVLTIDTGVLFEDKDKKLTPIFAFKRQVEFEGKVYFTDGEINNITYYNKSGNSTSIPIFILETKDDVVKYRGYFYDKEYFLKDVGYYCPILKQYRGGEKELQSAGRLKGYHDDGSTVIVKAKEDSGDMFFGIELERMEEVDLDYTKAAKDGWRCERDGSVVAEYISPVLSLSNYEESIQYIKDTSQGILDAEIDFHCGGHIHVSVSGVPYKKLYRKCAVFMPLLWAIYPERASNSYSQRPNKNRSGSQFDPYVNRDRRDLVMKDAIGTVEFRIFPGCRGEDMLRFRLKLLNHIVSTALKLKDDVTFKEALEYLMTSKEVFEILTLVYNTTSKLQGIADRIVTCYNSCEGIESTQDVTKQLYDSMSEFVSTKKQVEVKDEEF